MLDFSDQPYEYVPPKPRRLAIRFFKQWNRFFYLRAPLHRLRSVAVTAPAGLRALLRAGERRILFLPNHATHSDPQIVFETQRQLHVDSLVMSAYDIFLRGRLDRWVMQHTGAFSVDRDATDSRAVRQAMETLIQGKYALTLFAEGNVSLQNDQVCHFLDGPAFIALKAQRQLGADRAASVHAVPVSIKVTHVTDQRDCIRSRLEGLAAEAQTRLDPAKDPVAELDRIGLALLRKKLEQLGCPPPCGDDVELETVLRATADRLLGRLQTEMGLQADAEDEPLERMRRVRRHIHQIRVDPERADEHPQAARWAAEAMLAYRVLSYSGHYVREHPTMDRYGETVEKLMEDFYSRAVPPYGERCAFVRCAEPIDLASYRDAFTRKAREAVHELTARFEAVAQAGLDELNAANPYPGGEAY
ncbi:MAG: 1-acyl-sn-glycerol-3-phosphate acyltransferase [Kiritimatiellae bacterium]|nr:1-acyl-sn-glycerol-3-phosphate acyltransferase [Kiritimatiellia bacterium]